MSILSTFAILDDDKLDQVIKSYLDGSHPFEENSLADIVDCSGRVGKTPILIEEIDFLCQVFSNTARDTFNEIRPDGKEYGHESGLYEMSADLVAKLARLDQSRKEEIAESLVDFVFTRENEMQELIAADLNSPARFAEGWIRALAVIFGLSVAVGGVLAIIHGVVMEPQTEAARLLPMFIGTPIAFILFLLFYFRGLGVKKVQSKPLDRADFHYIGEAVLGLCDLCEKAKERKQKLVYFWSL